MSTFLKETLNGGDEDPDRRLIQEIQAIGNSVLLEFEEPPTYETRNFAPKPSLQRGGRVAVWGAQFSGKPDLAPNYLG